MSAGPVLRSKTEADLRPTRTRRKTSPYLPLRSLGGFPCLHIPPNDLGDFTSLFHHGAEFFRLQALGTVAPGGFGVVVHFNDQAVRPGRNGRKAHAFHKAPVARGVAGVGRL